MKWQVYDQYFYTDTPEISEPYNNEQDNFDDEILCSCYGRGKSITDVDFPRLPQLQVLIQKQRQQFGSDERGGDTRNKKSSGRGRARLLRQYTEKSSVIGQTSRGIPTEQTSHSQFQYQSGPAEANSRFSDLELEAKGGVSRSIFNEASVFKSGSSKEESDCKSVKSSGGFGRPQIKYQDFRYESYEISDDYTTEYKQPPRQKCTLESFLLEPKVKQSKNKQKKKSKKQQSGAIEKDENQSLASYENYIDTTTEDDDITPSNGSKLQDLTPTCYNIATKLNKCDRSLQLRDPSVASDSMSRHNTTESGSFVTCNSSMNTQSFDTALDYCDTPVPLSYNGPHNLDTLDQFDASASFESRSKSSIKMSHHFDDSKSSVKELDQLDELISPRDGWKTNFTESHNVYLYNSLQRKNRPIVSELDQFDFPNVHTNIRPSSPDCNSNLTALRYPSHTSQVIVKPDNRVLQGQKSESELGNAGEWNISGDNIVQIEGLPISCDLSVLEDIIASYGTVIEKEMLERGSMSVLRFQLDSDDACDWLVSCLHDSDCLYPDSSSRLVCFRVS